MASKENPALGEGGASGLRFSAEDISEDRLARQEPQAGPDAVERHGNWLVIGRDATRKRVTCKCATCGYVALIGAEALEGGSVFCSECAHPTKPDARADSFAGAVAGMETRDAWRRHRGGGGGCL
jgi:hypothetical protein